ncbi:MAG: cytochrome b/b6 domain-containing protein [Dehalococcoidia bacterium]|nr:cytochrome b/b6 domain-containing protein [Dehalococcoidia bacterium]
MERSEQIAAKRGKESVVRFKASQIFEHSLIMVAFTVLVITGLPQRFPDNSWSQSLIQNLGGIYTTRLIHRGFGFVLVFGAVYHIGFILSHVFRRKRPLSMMLTFRDFRDAIVTLRYDLGLIDQQPQLGHYDFRQKFEYWGMVFGCTVMILSGLILMYPIVVTRLLPGQLIPAAKAMHGYEGLLALLIILIWHLYGAHFGPEKFPFDSSIFTGRISRERMQREHSLEYQEMLNAEASTTVPQETQDQGGVETREEAEGKS